MNDVWNRLCDNQLGIFALGRFLPDTFKEDMKNLFGVNPEKDMVSEIDGFAEAEDRFFDGVVTVVGKDLSVDELKKRLITYAKEKKIDSLSILFKGEDGFIHESSCNPYDEDDKDQFCYVCEVCNDWYDSAPGALILMLDRSCP